MFEFEKPRIEIDEISEDKKNHLKEDTEQLWVIL